MEILVEERTKPKTKITIEPYIPETEPIANIGTWERGEVLMPGGMHREAITARGTGKTTNYLTGLNELAPEVLKLDEKTRKAKIKQIRKDIIFLERMISANAIPEDEKTLNLPYTEFMEKVFTVKPFVLDRDGQPDYSFWEHPSFLLSLNNTAKYLDTENPIDFIILRAIEAGGYSSIAPSYSVAKEEGTYKWYLNRSETTVSSKVVLSKIKNKAIAILDKLFSEDTEKLMYVLKDLVTDSTVYKPNTPHDALYEGADAYINGAGEERNIKKAATAFIESAEKKIEVLKLRAVVKDACIYNFLITKGDNKIHHAKSHTLVGANREECVEYLSDIRNDKILGEIYKDVEDEWKK
jgi:hypothetical protein